MKNLNLTFVAIIFALFALTSCEKESMKEMTQTTATEINERNLPAEGIHVVFDEVQTAATAESYEASANSRNRGYKEIECGFDYDGCTTGQGNSLDVRHYPREIRELAAEYNVRFDGQDEYFVWEVKETPGMTMHYDITLTDMQVDLDLFVFALNSRNQLSAVKGMSINSYSKDEKISLSNLTPGIYIVVVDAYRSDIAGHYNLTMECSAVGPGQSVELELIETTLGDAFPMGNGDWTFIYKDSDIAYVFEETYNNGRNFSFKNVRQEGGTMITANINISLDNNNIAIDTEYVERDGAVAIGDAFGEVIRVHYSN